MKKIHDGTRVNLEAVKGPLKSVIEFGWAHDSEQRPTFDQIWTMPTPTGWALLDGVNTVEVNNYVKKILALEAKYPPMAEEED
jgi:hypothetical protein